MGVEAERGVGDEGVGREGEDISGGRVESEGVAEGRDE